MSVLDDPRKHRYMEWLLTVPEDRQPAKAKDLCVELGVARRTLYDWRNAKEFRDIWEERAVAIAGDPERTQRVLDALYSKALDTTSAQQVQAAKAWAEIARVIRPAKIEEKSTDLKEMSADDLDALLIEMLEARASK